jgi:hypothetical protein
MPVGFAAVGKKLARRGRLERRADRLKDIIASFSGPRKMQIAPIEKAL